MLILHLALQIFSVNAGHQFESGFFTQFNYAYNLSLILFTSSMKFRSEEFFVPFAQEFSSIPDVYLNIALMDMALQFPQGYSLDITSITTLGFTMKTVCESPWLYFGINLNWFAFNDDSVQVINHLNITNPLWQYTHSYIKNLKINVAIANFVSYYAEGPQFNNLTGLSLTDDTVTISLYTNLKQFGYQILLASSDLILVGPTITSTLPYGSSQTVNFPSGWETTMCHPNLLGFYHDGTDFNIRLSGRVSYTSQIDLGFYPCNQQINIQGHATIILSIQYNYFCINYAYFDLAIFQGMTQTNYFDTKNEIENHVEIQEMNYNQSQDVEEEIKIPEGIQSIKINYYWKCQENQQLKMQIFCIRDIQQQYTSSNIQCKVGKTNTVRLSAKYLLTTNSQQYLKITKTSASFTATQIIKSSGLFQKLLYKVELIQ